MSRALVAVLLLLVAADATALCGLSELCKGQQGTGPCAEFGVFTFEDADVTVDPANTIAEAAHGFSTGDGPVFLTNAGGALPTGLADATPYWIIRSAEGTVQLASSAANAAAGTEVAITVAAGGGTHRLSGNVIAVDLRGKTRATFYASGTATSFICNVFGNLDGYDAASGVGQQLNTSALTETTRALVLEFPFLWTWIDCSGVAGGGIQVRVQACE